MITSSVVRRKERSLKASAEFFFEDIKLMEFRANLMTLTSDRGKEGMGGGVCVEIGTDRGTGIGVGAGLGVGVCCVGSSSLSSASPTYALHLAHLHVVCWKGYTRVWSVLVSIDVLHQTAMIRLVLHLITDIYDKVE